LGLYGVVSEVTRFSTQHLTDNPLMSIDMSYSQNLPQWKVVLEASGFSEVELGLGKR
jgi:hypothetical protein